MSGRKGYTIFVRNSHKCGCCLELHLDTAGDCGELEFFLRHGIASVKKTSPHLNTTDPQELCDKLKEALKRNSP